MSRVIVLVCVLGCGGGQKQAAPTSDCEPGRCLDDIAKRVQEHRATARACYDAKPGLGDGRIIINFEIDPGGTVVEVSQSVKDDQIDDKEVVACVADVIKEIEFAKSEKGKTTRAYHTFEFVARKQK